MTYELDRNMYTLSIFDFLMTLVRKTLMIIKSE